MTAPTLHRDYYDYSDFFKMEKIFQMTQVRVFGQKFNDLYRIEQVCCGFNTLQLIEMGGKKMTQ